jgi:hypothetical protein
MVKQSALRALVILTDRAYPAGDRSPEQGLRLLVTRRKSGPMLRLLTHSATELALLARLAGHGLVELLEDRRLASARAENDALARVSQSGLQLEMLVGQSVVHRLLLFEGGCPVIVD